MMVYILILIPAFLGSIIAGLFGGGAGLIFTPAMFLFLSHYNHNADHLMQTSITTMLTSLILAGFVASVKQQKYKHIDWNVIKWSAPFVVLGSMTGCYVMTLISSKTSKTLKLIFAIAILILAARYTYTLYSKNHHLKENNRNYKLSDSVILKYFGSFSLGLICTVSGAASFSVPYYQKIGLNIKLAIGTTTALLINFLPTKKPNLFSIY